MNTSLRLKALEAFSQEIYYAKLMARLTEGEFDEMVEFIEDNDDLDHLAFEYKVNRMDLDSRPKDKKVAARRRIMQELLTCVNSRAHGNPFKGFVRKQ